ncbi:hypothetical protein MCOR27_002809 [Pyricularia oryzae]|nr:hypothetical protein MCOR01_005765 [Pyricularia oryzae]KAH9434979.1 hypothetical protein MCOR02_012534 [Pyricularia oryzae]KAI6261743.1 hypothetical protein MCOR19_001958 [Pyricularia oryzae]KAI6284454.1 hypothetical protein MCOR27_002809 [Pyricularia oryzae]KAI6325995.1 hypothetical protein MCOR34_001001 [Pyricularia oryzae]
MAAATTRSPPLTDSPPSVTVPRKPLPLRDLPQIPNQSLDWDPTGCVKPLPTTPVPPLGSPRLRHPPRSPVRVSVKPDNWAQHSEGSIVNHHDTELPPLPKLSDRDIPKTPDAPTPPTWSPVTSQARQKEKQQDLKHHQYHHRARDSGRMAEESVRAVPAPTAEHKPVLVKHNSRPGTASHAEIVSPVDSKATLDSSLPSAESRPANPDAQVSSATTNSTPQRAHDESRNSRETGSSTLSTQTPQQNSTGSSVVTSASSATGATEAVDAKDDSPIASEESSLVEEPHRPDSVPQLQYHHSQFIPTHPGLPKHDHRMSSTPDLLEGASSINRHLTPNQFVRRSSMPRPQSSYSVYSDASPRGRSPGLHPGASPMRAPSAHSRGSPDVRPSSYIDMLNVPYPQPAPAPITLDNSQLRNAVGTNASLLSTQKTLEMYRQNVKKTNDLSIQYSFAVFLISTAQEQGFDPAADEPPKRKGSPKADRDSPRIESAPGSSPHELVREARSILQKLASNGYPFAQYYLADGYASGLFSKGKEDYNAAFPLFVLAAKHGHAESAYRAGLCYEFGWGCRKDPAKAVQFLRTAASKRHPGAMTRLGKACLSGDLGEKRYREGIKWLKLATESADAQYNGAPYHMGCLYETGYGDDIFKDESYAAELFTQAADLGHPEANFRMGEAYEHGLLNCPRDPALSVHFYTGAAERGHAGAMMGLCAWYMVGAEPILEKDEEEAYEWARRAAELGNVKAQYAVGYFTEMGIGCRRDILEANVWYVKAADSGDERAKQRLAAIRAAVSGGTPMETAPPRNGKIKKNAGDKDESCVVM